MKRKTDSVTSPQRRPTSTEDENKQQELYDNDENEQQHVMSEVHLGCPPLTSGPHVSHFTISLPPQVEAGRFYEIFKSGVVNKDICLDEDGDLIVTRRNSNSCTRSYVFSIQHNITSSIPCVGLQVWKAALVLIDYVLQKMLTSSDLDQIVALELGAGTGLVGILLARVAKTVFITDRGDEILDNCAENVQLNLDEINNHASVYVRELDWMDPWPPKEDSENSSAKNLKTSQLLGLSRYSWIASEIEEAQQASMLLAADVIYSDDLTDALFSTLGKLMSVGKEKVVYLALEKRYNFSLDDLNVVANGYSHFLSYLRDEAEGTHPDFESHNCFVGKKLDIQQVPQYITNYDRGNDVELWQIKYHREKCTM